MKQEYNNHKDWKKPYRMLLKEVEGINYDLKEKKRNIINDTKSTYQTPENCENCND